MYNSPQRRKNYEYGTNQAQRRSSGVPEDNPSSREDIWYRESNLGRKSSKKDDKFYPTVPGDHSQWGRSAKNRRFDNATAAVNPMYGYSDEDDERSDVSVSQELAEIDKQTKEELEEHNKVAKAFEELDLDEMSLSDLMDDDRFNALMESKGLKEKEEEPKPKANNQKVVVQSARDIGVGVAMLGMSKRSSGELHQDSSTLSKGDSESKVIQEDTVGETQDGELADGEDEVEKEAEKKEKTENDTILSDDDDEVFHEDDRLREKEVREALQTVVDRIKKRKEDILKVREKCHRVKEISKKLREEVVELEEESINLNHELETGSKIPKMKKYNLQNVKAIVDANARRQRLRNKARLFQEDAEDSEEELQLNFKKERSRCKQTIDRIQTVLARFVPLSSEISYVNVRYDKGVGSFFIFMQFLVNFSIISLIVYLPLLLRHWFMVGFKLSSWRGFVPETTLYSSFQEEEALWYYSTLTGMIVVSLFFAIRKWLQLDEIKRASELMEDKNLKYSQLALNPWDWTIKTDVDTLNGRLFLSNEARLLIEEEELAAHGDHKTFEEKVRLFLLRFSISLASLIILSASTFVIIVTIWNEKSMLNDMNNSGVPEIISGLVPSLIITAANAIGPVIIMKLTVYEKWSPSFLLKTQIWRLYVGKIFNMMIIAALIVLLTTKGLGNDSYDIIDVEEEWECREDQGGEYIVVIVLSEFLLSNLWFVVGIPIVSRIPTVFKKQPINFEFRIAQNIVNVIYFQSLLWLGFVLFPYMALVNTILMYAEFKLELFRINHIQSKPKKTSSAKDTVIYILGFFNITLAGILCLYATFLQYGGPHDYESHGGKFDNEGFCGPYDSGTAPQDQLTIYLDNNPTMNYLFGVSRSPSLLWVVIVGLSARLYFRRINVMKLKEFIQEKAEEFKREIDDIAKSIRNLEKQIEFKARLHERLNK